MKNVFLWVALLFLAGAIGCGPAEPPYKKGSGSGSGSGGGDDPTQVWSPDYKAPKTAPAPAAPSSSIDANNNGIVDNDEPATATAPKVSTTGNCLTKGMPVEEAATDDRYFVVVGQADFRGLQEQEAAFRRDWAGTEAQQWLRYSINGATMYALLVPPDYPEGFPTKKMAAYAARKANACFRKQIAGKSAQVGTNPRLISK